MVRWSSGSLSLEYHIEMSGHGQLWSLSTSLESVVPGAVES